MIFGELDKPSLAAIADMGVREITIMAPLVDPDDLLRFLSRRRCST